MERRMKVAIELYRAGVAPRILLSGGGSTVPEAEVMRRLALAAGIPESALLVEAVSRNTHENAIQAARLLGACGMTEVVLVTDRYHALRAHILFRLAGLTVRAVHVAPMGLQPRLRLLLSETVKLPFSILRALIDQAVRSGRRRS
jgi:uncharacterized SAM-binding protein YcdF (DUF218 family)